MNETVRIGPLLEVIVIAKRAKASELLFGSLSALETRLDVRKLKVEHAGHGYASRVDELRPMHPRVEHEPYLHCVLLSQ